jgi:hypothetical protein
VNPVAPVEPFPLTINELLTYKPVLSTRKRSHVPAPINNVHTHPAAAGNEPIIVLLVPVVIRHPLHNPRAMLLLPVVLLTNDL